MKIIVLIFIIAIFANRNILAIRNEGECMFRISNRDLGSPQPIYMKKEEYLTPDSLQGIRFDVGDSILLACTGVNNSLQYRNSKSSDLQAEVKCVSSDRVSGDTNWLPTLTDLGSISCNKRSEVTVVPSGNCYNNNTLYKIGYTVMHLREEFLPIYSVCFDEENLTTLYVLINQTAANAISQTVIPSPPWIGNEFYYGINMEEVYNDQQLTFDELLGVEQSNRYIRPLTMLTTDHVASLWHFIYEFSQRAAYSYLNSVPHWNVIAEGNWDILGQRLTARFSSAGYKYSVYSGNYGTLQLHNASDDLVDIYLYNDNGTSRIPVPLYMYKVFYEEKEKLGTAFVCVNNPYVRQDWHLFDFCPNECVKNREFEWLGFRRLNPSRGYCFCCEVDEFKKTVDHLPDFEVKGMLTGSAWRFDLSKSFAVLTFTIIFKYIF